MPDANHHYEVTLLPAQRALLIRALKGARPTTLERQTVIRLLEGAPRKPGPPLPQAALPWDEIEREAARQGCGPVDVIWDRAGKEPC